MHDWVALLRGVNVGGVTVKSAELRELFSALGLANARTVLASGNVAFSSKESATVLKQTIERALSERFGYDAWIVLVSRDAVAAAVDAFAFDAQDPARQPYVVFGSDDAVLEDLLAKAQDFDPVADPIAGGSGLIYWHPLKGTTLDTAFGKLLARREYRESTTTRNLRTLQKILG